jgi:2-polyprenyl-6-methoxyphenol hydroxylase-like FAD-dependent oxidoreductase
MERCKTLEALYSHVQNKSKVHARTAVVGYEETAQGVSVTTEDGEQYHGHILIGTDGIHSNVRKLMADKISVTDQSLAKEINEGCGPSPQVGTDFRHHSSRQQRYSYTRL